MNPHASARAPMSLWPTSPLSHSFETE